MTTISSEIMTFKSGINLFGLPIHQILTISGVHEDLHCKAFRSKETLGISEYQGTPVAVVDLAKANNIESTNEQKQQLVKMLKERQQDHIDWLNALENALNTNTEFTIGKDPHSCEFGQWYDSFICLDEDLQVILKEFDEPHKKLHSLADQLIDMNSKGETERCLEILQEERETTLTHLVSLFEHASNHIISSIRTVFIYLTIDGTTPCVALCVDEISDVETVAENGFTSMNDIALPMLDTGIKYLSGYQKLVSEKDCLLIDLELLLSNPELNQKQSKAS